MASYSVIIENRAQKEIRKLPHTIRIRIVEAIDGLETDPFPSSSKQLSGVDAFRLRLGDYRIIYTYKSKILTVIIVRVAHRREVYRGL